MHGIGEFAHMAKVSVRTLRHYDEIGLLHPAHVEASSGYRSYTADQLGELHRIIALKDVGLTLSEIHDTMDQSAEAVAELLEQRLVDLEAALAENSAAAFEVSSDGVSWRGHRLSAEDLTRDRAVFARSFGSCSFQEPVDDLQSLQLL